MRRLITIGLVMAVAFSVTGTALAIPMNVFFEDLPEQDQMPFGPKEVHELGNSPIFPPEEFIDASMTLQI